MLLALALVACGHEASTSNGATTNTAASTPAGKSTRGPGYDLVIKSTSCWMGGLWSDALGEKEFERQANIEKRCKDLLAYIAETPESYNTLRAVEPKIVTEIADRVKKDAGKEESAGELVAMLQMTAEATRETLHARRAADKVKEDAEKDRTQYAPDKVTASPELRKSEAVHALLGASLGGYTADAHAIGVLFAIDRMQIAHGLPKHLKIFVVGEPLKDIFGVAPPAVSDDGSMKVTPGLWLDHLQKVAAQSGRAVPPETKNLEDRETLAWNGVLDALGEKLVAASGDVPADAALGVVVHGVANRLHQQLEMERSLMMKSKK